MRKNKLKIIFFVLFLFLAVFSFFYIKYVWNKGIEEVSNHALVIAKTAEISLNDDMLKQLHAIPEDVGTVAYESLKNRLKDFIKVDKNIRFAYFYTERAGKIFFLVDSEPVESPDLSPAGQEFTEADWQVYQPFKDGKDLITVPSTDRWGTWVSVFIPVKNLETGEIFAVFGMDYPAQKWSDDALYNTIQAGIILFFLFLLLIAFYIIINNNSKLRSSEEKFATIFEYSPISINMTRYSDGKFVDVNKAFLDLTGYKNEEVVGKTSIDLKLWQNLNDRALIIKNLTEQNKSSKIETKWCKKTGDIIEVLVEAYIIRIKGEKYMLGLVEDITEKNNNEKKSKKRIEEIEKLNKLMIGRELTMVELKKEIIRLKEGVQ